MRSGQFTKSNLRIKQKKSLSVVQWPLLKYIMRKQQIQQMSSQSEDNGLIIFFKLKHLFFPDVEEDEQIISIVRQDPIKTIDKVLMAITQYYSEKLSELVQPLEEEKNHLLNRLKETKQKLQHSMDDNQYFKAIIDRLQEQKKDIECMLNQSQDQIERSCRQFETIADEKQKIKSEVIGIYQSYQNIMAENSQLKDTNFQIQKELIILKQKLEELVQANNNYQLFYKKIEEEKHQLYQQNCKLREENQAFTFKINQKEQFIASFISQYNKIHYFQRHQDSYNDTDKIAIDTSKDSDYNQLKGFNFNEFDKDSIQSQKSSKKSSGKISSKGKSNQKQGEIDQKFLYVNATAEKLKIPLPTKATGSEQKSKCDIVGIPIQRKNRKESEKNATAKIIFEGLKESKALAKAESSKNLRNRQSNVTPSDAEGSKMNIEQVLRKKLLEKNAKIGRLEFELNGLRVQYIQQRQNITEMQGNYELQITELKEQLKYLKTQFNTLYKRFALANSQCQIYQQKVVELQSQLARIEEEHQFYCEELKRRCKLYIIKKLDEAEVHYETIRSIEYSTKKKQQPEREYKPIRNIQKFYTEERYSEQDQQQAKQTLSLKLHQDLEDHQQSQELRKEDRQSDIYSYQHVQNHYMNGLGFDLELSLTNKNNDRDPLQEIYIRETFQIQSDLGGFTERLMEKNIQSSKYKGNLTQRVPAKMLKSMFDLKSRNKVSLESNVFNIDIQPKIKTISYFALQELTIYPFTKNLSISLKICQQILPVRKEINFESKSVDFNFCPFKKPNQISSELSLKINSFQQPKVYKVCKLQNFTFSGKQKILMKLYSNVFTMKQSEKNNKKNMVNTYINIYSNSQIQPQCKQTKIQTCTQTALNQSFAWLSQVRGRSNLSLVRVCSFEIQNKAMKDSTLSREIVKQYQENNKSFQQLQQIKNLVQSISQKQLIVSRLDQFAVNEIEEKINYESKTLPKHEHCRYNSVEYQQLLMKQSKLTKNIDFEHIKNEDLVQQSRVKQKTKASTVQTYAQWYQIDKIYHNIGRQDKKQKFIQNSPNESNAYYQETKKLTLNKAMILSNKNSEKADSQKSSASFNPESKHNRAVTQSEDFHITPWFVDEKKHLIFNNQIISLEGIPNELTSTMKTQNLGKLSKFLKQNRITLKFLQQVQDRNFKRPQDLNKKILILKTNNRGIDRTFLLGNKFLYCLQDKTKITINKQRFIDENNFSFGQAEIVISGDGKLKINRNNKRDRLNGNIEDGIWQINSYMTFEYKSKNNK